MVKKRISFKRGGKRVSFLRRPRKKLKRPKLKVGKKVYRRKIIRDSYGQFRGTRRVRK